MWWPTLSIKTTHDEFEGRAEWLTALTYSHWHFDYLVHGIHVAGITGSKTFGVAKKMKIKAVGAAVDINVSISNAIKGMEIAVNDHLKESGRKGLRVL